MTVPMPEEHEQWLSEAHHINANAGSYLPEISALAWRYLVLAERLTAVEAERDRAEDQADNSAAELLRVEAERDAYRKAKQENDERFQLAAAEQRERAEKAEAALNSNRLAAMNAQADLAKVEAERDEWRRVAAEQTRLERERAEKVEEESMYRGQRIEHLEQIVACVEALIGPDVVFPDWKATKMFRITTRHSDLHGIEVTETVLLASDLRKALKGES